MKTPSSLSRASFTRISRLARPLLLILAAALLAACQSAPGLPGAASATPAPTTTAAPATATATALAATETPTAAPSPSALPPSPTAVPALALEPDGLQILCLPYTYPLAPRSAEVFTSGETEVRAAVLNADGVQVALPVRGCGVFVTFNQPLAAEARAAVYEGADSSPWYSRPLSAVEGQLNRYYAILDHEYLDNPPVWNLSFGLKIEDASQVYWQGNLDLERPFSGLCWEGSVPDPLTLRCPIVDKLEREPHPDTPTFVPGGLR